MVTYIRLLGTVGSGTGETAMGLTAEQCRALAMLARAGLDGASQALLMAHGFCVSMIVGLVDHGLATLTREKVRAGSRLIEGGRCGSRPSGERLSSRKASRTSLSGLEPYGRLGGQPFHGLAKRDAPQGTARRSANPMPFPRLPQGDIIP